MQCTLGRKQGEVSEFGEGGNMSVLSVEGRGGGGVGMVVGGLRVR